MSKFTSKNPRISFNNRLYEISGISENSIFADIVAKNSFLIATKLPNLLLQSSPADDVPALFQALLLNVHQ